MAPRAARWRIGGVVRFEGSYGMLEWKARLLTIVVMWAAWMDGVFPSNWNWNW